MLNLETVIGDEIIENKKLLGRENFAIKHWYFDMRTITYKGKLDKLLSGNTNIKDDQPNDLDLAWIVLQLFNNYPNEIPNMPRLRKIVDF